METTAATIEAVAAELAITMRVEFVPWSKSRSATPAARFRDLNLNWKVTIQVRGRDVLTTDYSAGMAHAPSYSPAVHYPGTNAGAYDAGNAIRWECENGMKAPRNPDGSLRTFRPKGGAPILPALADVLYSLVMDASVIDYATYEDWAPDVGLDPDSRTGEKTYRLCLEHALKLRAALGEAGLEKLRTATEGY